MVCFVETPIKKIEDTFKELTTREDIAILLINQHVSAILHNQQTLVTIGSQQTLCGHCFQRVGTFGSVTMTDGRTQA